MTTETWMAIATILVPVALAVASGIFGLVGWILWKLIEALMGKYYQEHQELREEFKQIRDEQQSMKGYLKRSGALPSHFDRESPPLHITKEEP